MGPPGRGGSPFPGRSKSSGRRGRPHSGQGFLGWSKTGLRVVDPDCSHSGPGGGQAGGQQGGHRGRPWPSCRPVFSTSSPPGPFSRWPQTSPPMQAAWGGGGASSAQHSSKGSLGASRPKRKDDTTWSGSGQLTGGVYRKDIVGGTRGCSPRAEAQDPGGLPLSLPEDQGRDLGPGVLGRHSQAHSEDS